MNTLGSSKVHEKEVYSLWVILDHPVHKPGTFWYYQKVPQTGVLLILPNFGHPLYLVARTGSNSLETACGLGVV